MKLMFVENRLKTRFWEKIARALEADGHDICWLVQNHQFIPRGGTAHVISYPTKKQLQIPFPQDNGTQFVLSTDRNINYFGGNGTHYGHYSSEIERILDTERPDVVFGESTLFHELLCIKHCRDKDIRFLQPTGCRYPNQRFSFLINDTEIPFQGSADHMSDVTALEWVDRIANRSVKPDYMHKPRRGIKIRSFLGQFQVALGYWNGERYNTPSPWTKLALNRKLAARKRSWELLAARPNSLTGKFIVLYPLQLQPESSLDVWGNPYKDQVKLLGALLDATDEATVILVKPNPKSYYEISDELLELILRHPRLVPLSHTIDMASALKVAELVVTVTGTIAIEATLAEKPVVTLMKTVGNRTSGCGYVPTLSQLGSEVQRVREGSFPRSTPAEKIALLRHLNSTSYKGVISDPVNDPSCINDINLTDVLLAFRHVLTQIESGKQSECVSLTTNFR